MVSANSASRSSHSSAPSWRLLSNSAKSCSAPIPLDVGSPSTTPSTTNGSTGLAVRSVARERWGFRPIRAGEPPSSSASRMRDVHPLRCLLYLAFVFAGRPPRYEAEWATGGRMNSK
eukprot:1888554-Prymnesium_polylepis.1